MFLAIRNIVNRPFIFLLFKNMWLTIIQWTKIILVELEWGHVNLCSLSSWTMTIQVQNEPRQGPCWIFFKEDSILFTCLWTERLLWQRLPNIDQNVLPLLPGLTDDFTKPPCTWEWSCDWVLVNGMKWVPLLVLVHKTCLKAPFLCSTSLLIDWQKWRKLPGWLWKPHIKDGTASVHLGLRISHQPNHPSVAVPWARMLDTSIKFKPL